ncbi:trichohyalin isoform X1 [Eupeodes corollae]|uniref:trichohyalin isoform X1 n=1 Tax=Eupeodes corollae TaxID=290404 RepID=UPI002490C4B1|nr:trichohyalin isoform X1 [Eupeodes corollae]
MLPEVGELVFSFVVGYMGVLEFLYVVRHLYHWGFRHNSEMRDYKSEAESLRKLQEQLKNAIAEAKEREALGLKAMEDGVVYKDGFRIDEDKKKIEELKEKVRIQEKIAERQREIEEELERQRKIEEETRRQLKKAEEELRQMEEEKKREKQKAEEEKRKAEEVKRKAEEEEKRKAESAKRKAEDEKRRAEEEENKRKQLAVEEENMKKIVEAERKREEEQRRQEEEKENERKLLQAEREREEKQRQLEKESEKKKIEEQRRQEEAKENERKLIEAEKEREERQRQQEIEDEKIVQKLLEAERQREIEEKERQADLERKNTAKLIAAEQAAILKQREQEENEENVQKLLKAERELELKKQEMEEEAANLQRLIEAEKAMEERQRKIDEEALLKLKNAQEEIELRQTFDANTEAEEEAFVKKQIGQAEQTVPQTVKTQYGQKTSDSLKPKSMLFTGVSEESSSAEPASSLQSSFSTQQSSEAVVPTDLHFDEYERQAPDGGEDMPSLQYSDDYLRSLDGIKNKPLVREDGSGRRRAFKKRRSSGSSTSSRESRASREEELKMFTSLEEEESENIRKGDSEYESIKYASEPNLKVGKQRRHKRSPAKDAKRDPNDKGSLEMLDEEDSNPWGEVKPENYKNTDFWKREKNLSIDEEQEEFDARQRIQSPSTAAVNIPKMSSFEEATKSQHQEAIMALKRQRSKDPEPIQEPDEESETKNLIFSGEYTKAMNKDWHSGHFCCWQCDESLTGQRYVIRDDHPYCIKCYENVFANTCEECSKIIGIDSKDLSYKDKHWHEACFLCNKCRISLVDKQFGAKADKIYCGNCYDAQFASRCDGCGEVFRAGTKKMEYKTRQWHEKCFCCCVCKTPIGTKSFIPREQEIYCAGCYEEKFATRCIKCNKVITAGGVTYKNEPWHRECFTCTNCNITLAGQRFTSRDEKPYCADCFGELFAKRCTACVKPITGIGGTRFISFEDRHWHHDCFICASCKTSLVGRGFITDGPDIICPECAKQKLI